MKHTLCDLQEKIFHLQIQLLEEDIAGGESRHSCDFGCLRPPEEGEVFRVFGDRGRLQEWPAIAATVRRGFGSLLLFFFMKPFRLFKCLGVNIKVSFISVYRSV